jgi:hypothetical protein
VKTPVFRHRLSGADSPIKAYQSIITNIIKNEKVDSVANPPDKWHIFSYFSGNILPLRGSGDVLPCRPVKTTFGNLFSYVTIYAVLVVSAGQYVATEKSDIMAVLAIFPDSQSKSSTRILAKTEQATPLIPFLEDFNGET